MSTPPSPPSNGVRHVLVILGMHRSGTSAISGVFAALGFELGSHLVPAAPDNPLGYFENADVVEINDDLLLALGLGWDDPRPLPQGWMDSAAAREAEGRIAALWAREFAGRPRVAIKDPRLCRLFPLWRTVLARLGVDVRVLIASRAVSAVARSLAKRDDMTVEHAATLWVQHFADAERASRGLVRTACDYDRLLASPAGEVARLLGALSFALPEPRVLDAAVATLDGLQRHFKAEPLRSPFARTPANLALERWLEADGTGELDDNILSDIGRAMEPLAIAREARARALNAARVSARQLLDRARALAAALAASEGLVSRQQVELSALDARLKAADEALAQAQELLGTRDDEVHHLHRALREVEVLAVGRLSELEAGSARERRQTEAISRLEALALERLEELKQVDSRLMAADRAIAVLESLATERLATLSAMEVSMREQRETYENQREALTLDRDGMALEKDAMAAERDARSAECVGLRDDLRAAADALALRSGELEAMVRSRSWRMTAPLRWIERWWGR